MPADKEDYLVVRDFVWLLRFRALGILGVGGLVATQLRSYPDSTFYWTLFLLFTGGGIASLLGTFNPQTRLVIDATGIWTSEYDTVEWQQLASFYSTEYTGTEETSPYLVFTTLAAQEILVNMDAADTDFDTIRQAIKRLNTNAQLRDYGQR